MRPNESSFTAAEVGAILDAIRVPAIVLRDDYAIVAANAVYQDRFATSGRVVGSRCHKVSHGYDVPCDEKGEPCPFQSCRTWPCSVTHEHLVRGGGRRREEITIHALRRGPPGARLFFEVFRPLEIPTDAAVPPLEAVGRSAPFRRLQHRLARVAATDIPVLLLGESGTGKELAALALHARSPRAPGPFVPFDCSGVPETLFESELVGHEKGAFTGAIQEKRGLVEVAAGGTLFLDEIGDAPLSVQVKLLRILESGLFRRVGSTQQRRVSFRLVCATHRDLAAMVEAGTFRRDLFYRISVFPVRLPPLRERMEDLPELTDQLLRRIHPAAPCVLHPDALAVLRRHDFPGNVRELLNVLQHGCLLSEKGVIRPEHLPEELLRPRAPETARAPGPPRAGDSIVPLEEAERAYLAWAAERFRGDKRELARRLGLSTRTLYRKLAAAGWPLGRDARAREPSR